MLFEVLAAKLGAVECCWALLGAGARANSAPSRRADTPLRAAAAEGHVECVRALLEARANPNPPGCEAPGVRSRGSSPRHPLHSLDGGRHSAVETSDQFRRDRVGD